MEDKNQRMSFSNLYPLDFTSFQEDKSLNIYKYS